mmetsp:Transcript_8850/g.11771  ORF Transcript_8850/g.11771 Transcript_8850/m.11771 type:complete len:177 (-) Transcript_8850:64-594(-)
MGRPALTPKNKTAKPDRRRAPSPPTLITREFSQEEILEFRDAFAMFDLDGGGTIEFKELHHVLKELGDEPSREEIEEMILLVDENGDGEIDFDEFLTLMRLRLGDSGEDAEQNLKDVFNIFDADGSGFIDKHEMRLLMKKLAQDLTEEEITQIIEVVDKDEDGEISFEEFKTLVSE